VARSSELRDDPLDGEKARRHHLASRKDWGADQAAREVPMICQQSALYIEWITLVVEGAGIAVILIGAVVAFVAFMRNVVLLGDRDAVAAFLSDLGRSIALGLEFLVAADIINTVAIEPSLDSVAVLAGIVAIRTFLSFSLEVKIQGRWPRPGKGNRAEG
jgi:uncharacterized membrane protein